MVGYDALKSGRIQAHRYVTSGVYAENWGNGIDLSDVTAGEWLERCGSFLTASYRATQTP